MRARADEEALLYEVLCAVLQPSPPAAVPGDAVFRVAVWPPAEELERAQGPRADGREHERERGARGG